MYSTWWYISVYALWPQSFHVARVVFQSLQRSWQTAPCTSATIATISTKGMFSFWSFTSSWPLSPMASSQKFQVDPPFSTRKMLSANLYCSSIWHVFVKTGIWGHHGGDKQSTFRRNGKGMQTNTTNIATWDHEPIISNAYEDIMKEIKQSVYWRDGKWKQTKTTTTATWGHETTISNGSMHPPHTSHPVYFLFRKIS